MKSGLDFVSEQDQKIESVIPKTRKRDHCKVTYSEVDVHTRHLEHPTMAIQNTTSRDR